MEEKYKKKRNISVDHAVKILKQNGIECNENEAENILEMMYFFAKLIVNQKFKNGL